MTRRTVLVTGATRGVGRELAALQRTLTPVEWELDEVQKPIDNGLPTVGASPHSGGSAVHWS